MASYNLLREPWIHVMMSDGANQRMGIREAFEHSGQIRLITGDPHTRLVILRLLAAIHARALTAAGHGDDTAHAQRLWAANHVDMDAINAYLREWEDRFDLFDHTHPFMQDAGLRVKFPRPARTLTPWDRDRGPFGPAMDRRSVILAADAAIALLLDLAYDTAGIKAAPDRGRAYPPVTGMVCDGWPGPAAAWVPQTGSLAHDLLAMSPMPYSPDDLPCWEHSPLDGDDVVVRPTGMIQAWTLPTRRIRLTAGDDGIVTSAHATYGVVPDSMAMYDADPLVCLNPRTGTPVYRSDAEPPLWLPPAWARVDTRPHWFPWGAQLIGGQTTRVECSVAVYQQAVIEDMPSMTMTLQSRWLADANGMLTRFLFAIRQMADAWVRMQRRFEIGAGRRTSENMTGNVTHDGVLRDQHTMADMLRDLTPLIEQTLADPEEDTLDLGVIRIAEYMRERGRESFEQHAALSFNMRYPAASAWTTFMAGVKIIAANWREPVYEQQQSKPAATSVSAPVVEQPKRRGRRSKPVIRSGGNLPDRQFGSATQAVEWLRGHGHARAALAGISAVCNSQKRTAYGYSWRFADR